MKKISAIISTYNSALFIAGRLDDLLGQTLAKGLEIIVVDSGSDENEGSIVREYMSRHRNIVYIRTEIRESIYKAWNRAIKIASGNYITNANCDDRLRPDALEILACELDRDHDIALAYGDFFITGYPNMTFHDHIRTGYSLKPDFSVDMMLSGCHMGPQPMWRKAVHAEVGLFDEDYIAAGDYEFWCRMVAYGYQMKHITQFLGLYFHNAKGIVNSNIEICRTEERKIKAQFGKMLPQAYAQGASGYFYTSPVYEHEYANVCFNIEEVTEEFKRTLEVLWRITRFPYCITVVLNGADNISRNYLEAQKRRGIIKNLIVANERMSGGEALNRGVNAELKARYFVNVEDNICLDQELWLRNMVKYAFEHKKCGVVVSSIDENLWLTSAGVFKTVGGFENCDKEYVVDYFLRVMNHGHEIADDTGKTVDMERFIKREHATYK